MNTRSTGTRLGDRLKEPHGRFGRLEAHVAEGVATFGLLCGRESRRDKAGGRYRLATGHPHRVDALTPRNLCICTWSYADGHRHSVLIGVRGKAR